jgi:hypothetical protein
MAVGGKNMRGRLEQLERMAERRRRLVPDAIAPIDLARRVMFALELGARSSPGSIEFQCAKRIGDLIASPSEVG